MFSDNKNLKKFVESDKETKRRAFVENMIHKMYTNSFFGSQCLNKSYLVTLNNIKNVSNSHELIV